MNHLLKLQDLSTEEILHVLDLADQLKYENKHGIVHQHLKGKSIGLIFQKSSTRTRVSFETGIYQLGGQPLFLSANDMQIGRGEPVQDTARVLSRYLDGIMIRTYKQSEVEDLGGQPLFLSANDMQIGRGEPVQDTARVLSRYLDGIMIRTYKQSEVEDLAKYGSIPIINGLTDYCHPCQVLADLMTIREKFGHLEGLKMAYIGDGNNMANSLIVGGLKTGMKVSVATPEGYRPDPAVLEFAKQYGDQFFLTDDPKEAVKDADVVFTDTWASMWAVSRCSSRPMTCRSAAANPFRIRPAFCPAISMAS